MQTTPLLYPWAGLQLCLGLKDNFKIHLELNLLICYQPQPEMVAISIPKQIK